MGNNAAKARDFAKTRDAALVECPRKKCHTLVLYPQGVERVICPRCGIILPKSRPEREGKDAGSYDAWQNKLNQLIDNAHKVHTRATLVTD